MLSDHPQQTRNTQHATRHTTLLVLLLTLPPPFPSQGAATAQHGMVATVHPMATEAALQAMKSGGNAIDAALAAALTLGVVDGHNSGIGGGCFMLIRLANGSIIALDGRETAPASASRDMYLRNGKADTDLSQTGPLAAGVPGALAAYAYASQKYGKLPLKSLLLPAAKTAEDGFRLDRRYASALSESVGELKLFDAARAIFLHPDGSPYKRNELLLQPDLAKTYRAIAENGIDWFYRGPFAQMAGDWMKKHHGLLSRDDFAGYQVKLREPLRTTYHGFGIVGFPPPSSGGVHVAQILNILEQFDIKAMAPNSADFVHVTAEAMKVAFADRAYWLGDADFVPVPKGLVSKEYAAKLAWQIKLDKTLAVPTHGIPPDAQQNLFGKHTTHFSTTDAEGNWVACTATINTSFGCKVVIPGTGVVLNNQMDDFSIQPGVSNFFGLVGAEANAVAPGKRPLSSMSPTIVLKDGQPILAVGAAGGPTIISQTVLALINTLDFHMPIDVALAQPRFHHQWKPDQLKIEKRAGSALLAELQSRGHKLSRATSLGAAQAVAMDPDHKVFTGSADPRGEGLAKGF